MINEDYVSFEVAKLLKEKGFDEACIAVYEEEVLRTNTLCDYHNSELSSYVCAPTLQMAMKWLRENNNLAIIIKPRWAEGDMRNPCLWFWEIMGIDTIIRDSYAKVLCASYQEAVEAAIKYCLENLI